MIDLNPNVETIEKVGDTKTYKSNANSIRGLILGLIQKFRNDVKKGKTYSPKELEMTFDEALRKFNECYPQKIIRMEIIEGWEKEGSYPIEKNFDNDFIVEIWHKDNKERMVVKKENLNKMLIAIRKLEKGKIYKCYDIVKLLGYEWKEVWANRMSIYFPEYYTPLKIFNKLGIINYGGNKKNIIRLK